MDKIIALLALIIVIMLGSMHGQLKDHNERIEEISHELLIHSVTDLNGKEVYLQNEKNIKILKGILEDGR